MNSRIILALAFASAAGLAGSASAGDQREALRQQALEQVRANESYSHRERIRILEEADACIQGAATADAYRTCERQEKQAREAHQAEMREKRQALREQVRERSHMPPTEGPHRPST